MKLSQDEQRRMQQRLELRYAAAGEEARELLERRLSALSPDCALLTRWCCASSPVSDWANYDCALFIACAKHALHLWERSPLVRALPEPLFLNYVLHPRVNEEELCDCRSVFFAQLENRVRGLGARETILAVNEWCAEQVCYRATDERTISALGVWRSGFGRCGEESTFTVNALRAVGIPARQVYTPRWAHCDDNHAWVEAFCDGAWHFLGACEPEETLDRGWFTGAASRAILVHSRCFGTPGEDEDVITADGAVTFLNQTARYARVRTLEVQVYEADGRPAAGAAVSFGILNESQIIPAARIRTDIAGTARLRCGYGDLIIRAEKQGLCHERLCPAGQTDPLTLRLAEPEAPAGRWMDFTIHAPKQASAAYDAPTPAQSVRATRKAETAAQMRRRRAEQMYNAARVRALRERFGYGAQIETVLRAACGNFGPLAEFLEDLAFPAQKKLALLQTLGEKDWRDVRPEVLREALMSGAQIPAEDTPAMQNILCPRIGTEPLACCRGALRDSFSDEQKRAFCASPEKLWRWIRENIRHAPEVEYRQLVTLPAGAMRLRCADLHSQRLLFVTVCRAFGIAARLDPASGAAEYASGGKFLSPEPGQTPCAAVCFQKQPGELWQSGADFGLAVCSSGAWQPVSLGGASWEDGCLTVPLRPGVYRVLTDNRLPNGDLRASRMEFRLEAGETKYVRLRKQTVSLAELAVDFPLADFQAEAPDGRRITAAELTRTPALLLWPEEGREPTEHALRELLARQTCIRSLPVRLVFLLRGQQALRNETLRDTLAAFPEAEVWFAPDCAESAARSAYVEQDRLPLLLLCDRPRHIIHASAGYRVGSVDTALDFCRMCRG